MMVHLLYMYNTQGVAQEVHQGPRGTLCHVKQRDLAHATSVCEHTKHDAEYAI